MTVIGKVGKAHGKDGFVKVIPTHGMAEMFNKIREALVMTDSGEQCELENIRQYNRGRFLGTLNGFRSRNDVERFQGAAVVVEK